MTLPWFDGANYTLCRESPELQGEFREVTDGRVTAGWELRVPERGDDGVPFQFIFVGPTQEHRGAGMRLSIEGGDGTPLPPDAPVRVESYHRTGANLSIFFEGPYERFVQAASIGDGTVPLDRRAEAGEDYVIRVTVSVPEGAPEPDPSAGGSYFELDCVKLWWNETA